MASELIVQTIQGPSSGANANKVIIPSGHTFIGSAGQVVKTTKLDKNTEAVVQSQSYTSVWSGSYTPVLASSTLIFDYRLVIRHTNQTNAEARYYLVLYLNGVSADVYSALGTYDFGGHGVWSKDMVSQTTSYSNTTGNSVSFDFQIRNIDAASAMYTTLCEGSNRSSLIITEIAQ